MTEIHRDGTGKAYVDVENVRITYVPHQEWAGSAVLRVQAYRGDGTQSLHSGAEFPVGDPDSFIRLISGLCEVYNIRDS